eukprot:CAMPEP_0198592722 /NCGR_PEP_ID=MMETSP1462-20131121/138479_1 /TAXON_ID=1333877 /ORGANISM="Brandtodinium nutriculum, Strain RCC3387" /LENGTH=57 /DNA_ID=CAMNT_0044324303 /DNA_START=27 /DNA_END=197 /DNA_ORIENTATION=+
MPAARSGPRSVFGSIIASIDLPPTENASCSAASTCTTSIASPFAASAPDASATAASS